MESITTTRVDPLPMHVCQPLQALYNLQFNFIRRLTFEPSFVSFYLAPCGSQELRNIS